MSEDRPIENYGVFADDSIPNASAPSGGNFISSFFKGVLGAPVSAIRSVPETISNAGQAFNDTLGETTSGFFGAVGDVGTQYGKNLANTLLSKIGLVEDNQPPQYTQSEGTLPSQQLIYQAPQKDRTYTVRQGGSFLDLLRANALPNSTLKYLDDTPGQRPIYEGKSQTLPNTLQSGFNAGSGLVLGGLVLLLVVIMKRGR